MIIYSRIKSEFKANFLDRLFDDNLSITNVNLSRYAIFILYL